jgi:hypothetical protein
VKKIRRDIIYTQRARKGEQARQKRKRNERKNIGKTNKLGVKFVKGSSNQGTFL